MPRMLKIPVLRGYDMMDVPLPDYVANEVEKLRRKVARIIERQYLQEVRQQALDEATQAVNEAMAREIDLHRSHWPRSDGKAD